jgi:hypothetical protein
VEPATELMLLGCFGVEPQLLDAGVPWCYNQATYRVGVDGLDVTLVVTPAYCQVRLDVRRDGRPLFEFNADWVSDLRVIDERGVDAFEVGLGEGSWLRAQLRPAFVITQGFAPDAEPGAAADGWS